jgi:hypothetical protein
MRPRHGSRLRQAAAEPGLPSARDARSGDARKDLTCVLLMRTRKAVVADSVVALPPFAYFCFSAVSIAASSGYQRPLDVLGCVLQCALLLGIAFGRRWAFVGQIVSLFIYLGLVVLVLLDSTPDDQRAVFSPPLVPLHLVQILTGIYCWIRLRHWREHPKDEK